MKLKRILQLVISGIVGTGLVFLVGNGEIAQQIAMLEQVRPPFTGTDIWTIAVVLTYEAQVFPEPQKSQAYRAVAWTIRNRAATGYDGATGYADREHLLDKYGSFGEHQNDVPDSRALEIASEVLSALTESSDPVGGARHYVDNSYWTGTHEQTVSFQAPGMHRDTEIQQMIDRGRFVFSVEWKSPPDYPKGPLFYGLYFFKYWAQSASSRITQLTIA